MATEQAVLALEEYVPAARTSAIRYAVCPRCAAPVRPDSPVCGWCGKRRGGQSERKSVRAYDDAH